MENSFKRVKILVDENKNLVLFPYGKSLEKSKGYFPAYFPIELKHPYTAEELSLKIEYAMSIYGKYECYGNFSGKNTYEEKYYGIKGFKNAVKGKKMISLHQGDNENKIILSIPCKRGYTYYGIEIVNLPEDSSWNDYAQRVIEFVNTDLNSFKNFKINKNILNF